MSRLLIDVFNQACNNIAASYLKVCGESMSDICSRNTAKDNLLHLYNSFCNIEPLGMKFNTMNCSVTVYLIFIQKHRGKEGMNNRKYHMEIGTTEFFTKRTTEAAKGLGQSNLKWAMKDFYF